MKDSALPNFFLVGTGKAGTTSLFHYLGQHPQIYMSPIKEPCYFASEIRPENLTAPLQRHVRRMSQELASPFGWLRTEWDDYVRLFSGVKGETAIGEASAAYLWSETAAANICAKIPHAKIMMILRDPSERAFSQYLHQLAMGLTHSTFREHIEKCLENTDRKLGIYYPNLEVGLYYEQVRRYLDRFPRGSVRIYWFEAWREPQRMLKEMFEFLNVDSTFAPDTSRKSLQRRAPRSAGLNYAVKQRLDVEIPSWLRPLVRKLFFRSGRGLEMDPEDRRFLIEYYREDISRLGALLERDLSSWLQVTNTRSTASG